MEFQKSVTTDGVKKGKTAKKLTDELMIEIFRRLPIKSIIRFQCVSKAWYHLTSDDYFRKLLPQALAGFFYQCFMPGTKGYIQITSNNDYGLIDTALSFLPVSYGDFILLDVCNGLILCDVVIGEMNSYYLVCNPATRRWAWIPKLDNTDFSHTYLAFDPNICRHFKICKFGPKEEGSHRVDKIYIFSSKTGEWVQRKGHEELGGGCLNKWDSTFVNGIFYKLIDGAPSMVRIDIEREVGLKIGLPGVEFWYHQRCLGLSQGNLHFALKKADEVLVWVFDETSGNIWVLKHRISSESITEKLKSSELYTSATSFAYNLDILAIHPDSDVIFFSHLGKLISYHLIRGDLAVVCGRYIWRGTKLYTYSPCYLDNFEKL